MFRSFVAVLAALSLVACTSMRPVSMADKPQLSQSVKVGDEVSVVATNGKTYVLVLTAVDDQKIIGTGDNKKVTIRYEQIKSLEVREVSVGRTTALSVGVLAAVFLTVVVVILSKVDIQ